MISFFSLIDVKNIKNKNEKSVCIIILFEMTLTHITSFVKKKCDFSKNLFLAIFKQGLK